MELRNSLLITYSLLPCACLHCVSGPFVTIYMFSYSCVYLSVTHFT
ncbi:hypothetical protein SLEP1_g22188 [Rubroshorea leprosula]|uniref:Uncharacterized protein n=1 Tax=Rubroshorea leprosula TaxID=152421 RepID=A0AAV5JDR8_9ROSI|nr:hypothetical protein SLEP1_g22188 [Rubroshorea leprosula]